MTIRYVQTNDNKYLQYFLTKNEWSANVEDWEKLNLEEEVSQLGQKIKGHLLAVNNLGCTSYYYAGYVNSNGGITSYSQDKDFAAINSPYKVLIVPIDVNKTYKYYHDCPNPGGNILYGFFDSDMHSLSNTGYSVAARTWTTLAIPEGAAYFAMTIQFDTFFTDYQKCCVVENTPYYQKLESSFPVADDSISKVFFDNKFPGQTVINKALTYVTALGSNQRIYAGYIIDLEGNHGINFLNTEPETSSSKLIIAKVAPGITYDLYPYCSTEQQHSADKYIGCYAFYDESLHYINNTFVSNTPRNVWNSIVAPEGSVYIAIGLEFGDALGDYRKCCFSQRDRRLEPLEVLPSIENAITWGLPAKQFPPKDFVKNAYVTSAGTSKPYYGSASDVYKILCIPVEEGQIYSYNVVASQGSSILGLNCFATANLLSKVPANTNFYVRVGENEITIPAGVSYLCLTIKFGASSQYEGASISLKGSLEYRVNRLEEQYQDTESETIGVKVKKIGTTLHIATNWDNDNYLVQEMICHRPVSIASNPNANFIQIKKVPKTSSISSTGTILKGASDDICPAYINGSYIGGNHGWNKVYVVIANEHGKTTEDIGARYSKGEYAYKLVIMRVVDENTLWMAYEGTNNLNPISGNLVYVDNGQSTSDISVNSASLIGNFYGSVKEASYKLLGDNKELIEDGTYNFKEFSLIENYDILDFISIVNAVISNRPQGGYSDTPIYQNLPGVETLATRAVTYKFMSNGTCLVGTSLYARKTLSLSFDGVVQCMRAGNKIYVPKVLPITKDGITYDFTKISDWAASGNPTLTYPTSTWEDIDNAPDRIINFQSSTGFCAMLGYITDRGIEINRKNILGSGSGAIYLAGDTGKLYPNAISDNRTMNPGDCYSVIAYRAFSNKNLNPTARTNFTSVKVNNVVFIFVDYHDSIKDIIPIEDEWIGKRISVYEKTNNVELLSDDCVGGAIAINSQVVSNSYGYIVLKLSD